MKHLVLFSFLVIILMTILGEFALAQDHFPVPTRTDNNHSLAVVRSRIDDRPMQPGDEIGVFDPDGVCAGASVYNRVDTVGVALWGDEADTDEDEGFEPGDRFLYRLWDARHELEMEVTRSEVVMGQERWEGFGLTIVRLYAVGIPVPESPELEHDFGVLDMVVDQPVEWTTEITNNGNGAFQVDALRREGDEAFFEVEFDAETILPDSSADISFTFPRGEFQLGRQYQLRLTVENEDTARITFHLTGTLGAPRCQFDRAEITFPETFIADNNELGYTWFRRDTISVLNTGNASMLIEGVAFGDTVAFYLPPGTPVEYTIPPLDSARIPIVFNPYSVGFCSTWVTLETNVAGEAPRVFLRGSGADDWIGVPEETPQAPLEFALYGAFPNPFNQSAEICFNLPSSQDLRLILQDALGREVLVLAEGFYSTGKHSLILNASNLSAGVYFLKLETGGTTLVKNVTLVK